MERVCIAKGPYSGLMGDAVYIPQAKQYSVSIPNFKNPQIKELVDPKDLQAREGRRPSPILDKKNVTTLQCQKYKIYGYKKSCSISWCQSCFVNQGISKKIAQRLSVLKYKATRQVVLTIDLKKFSGSGQEAYETIKKKGAINQFIHNLQRTSGIIIHDWVWILEWHKAGDPHWHLFIETEEGKKGQIGNKNLLKHWNYGLVFESYIKSKTHWGKFTDYFSANGYFDPKSKCESKDKTHQLELPKWANEIDDYSIRKYGSKTHKSKISDYRKNKFVIQNLLMSIMYRLETNDIFKQQIAVGILHYLPKAIVSEEIKDQLDKLDVHDLQTQIIENFEKIGSLLIAHKMQNNVVYKNQIAVFITKFIEKTSNHHQAAIKEKERRKERTQKKYSEKIESCGQATNCKIIIEDKIRLWKTFKHPYKMFIRMFKGTYIPKVGYFIEMGEEEFSRFLKYFDIAVSIFHQNTIHKSNNSVSLSVG